LARNSRIELVSRFYVTANIAAKSYSHRLLGEALQIIKEEAVI
jgi:hypothetical protein